MLTFSSAIRITISARGAALLLYVLPLSGLLRTPADRHRGAYCAPADMLVPLNFIAPRHFNSIELSHPLRAARIHSVTTWEAITGG
jgi:hypothetical protein